MSMMIAALLPSSPLRGIGEMLAPAAPSAAAGQPVMDVMPIADSDKNGKVTPEEYAAFSRQGWGFVSRGNEQVKWAQLDPMARVSLLGIVPNAEGVITRQMYLDAIPGRFRMLDRNGDGALSSDEINGRAFES